ncbi:MAG TPA: response regulator transcription factor [Dehalococcoidia bacterium]|nr:response regulator transcription factor [Dehalococcoidia bacterium]
MRPEVPDTAPLVLIIDEVQPVVKLLQLELGFQGFRTETVLIVEDSLGTAEALQPDAIILGALLPNPDLYNVLNKLKQTVTSPIIFVNGSGNTNDAALAVEMGADDIVERPFNPEDMGMRLRALTNKEVHEKAQIYRGRLHLDTLRRIVWLDERRVAAGTNEWALLLALARADRPLSTSELSLAAWGKDYAGESDFVRIWIRRLRATLDDDDENPQVIVGNAHEGYRLAD